MNDLDRGEELSQANIPYEEEEEKENWAREYKEVKKSNDNLNDVDWGKV